MAERHESVRMKTDQRRTLVLAPLWCDTKQEWLLRDEALRVYEATFGALQQGEQLQLWLDGRDVTHAHFLDSYRARQPTQSITLATVQAGPFSARKVGPSAMLDLTQLARHSTEKRRELLRTETAQFVMQRLPLGGAVGEANDTLPERHAHITQFILVLQGVAEVTLSADEKGRDVLEQLHLTPQQSVVVPPNTYHFVRQAGPVELVFFSVYSPPEPLQEFLK